MRRIAIFATLSAFLGGAAGLIWLLLTTAVPLPSPSPTPRPLPTPHTPTQLPQPITHTHPWTSWAMPLPIRALQPQNNLLWVATDGGLLVWDTTTNAPPAHFRAEHGLPSHHLTSLTLGRANHLWVGTAGAGLARYDGHTWHTYTTTSGLPSDHIHALGYTPAHQLWAATAAGLSLYDPRTDQWHTSNLTPWRLRPTPIHTALATAEAWWLATPDGLQWHNGRTSHTFTTADGLPSNHITTLARTPHAIWAGTPHGLAWWDGATWHTIPGLEQPILTLAEGAQGGLWIGQPHRAIWLADPTAVPQLFPLIGSTLLQDVQAIAPTSTGAWLATRHAAHHLTPTGQWQTLPLPAAPTQPTHMAWANGETWLATAEGAYQLIGHTWQPQPTLHGRPIHQLTALASDGRDGLLALFNTPAQGWLWRPAGADWQPQTCQTGAQGRIYGSTVRHVQATPSGALWFIGHDGLFWVVPSPAESGTWECTFLTAEGYTLPSQTAVLGQNLLFLQGGSLWQATAERLTPLPLPPTGTWHALATSSTNPNGEVWTASPTHVGRFDGQTWVVHPITPPLSEVRSLALGRAGEVWLATPAGVLGQMGGRSSWQPPADGLASFDVYQLWVAPDGSLWLATTGGLVQRK